MYFRPQSRYYWYLYTWSPRITFAKAEMLVWKPSSAEAQGLRDYAADVQDLWHATGPKSHVLSTLG